MVSLILISFNENNLVTCMRRKGINIRPILREIEFGLKDFVSSELKSRQAGKVENYKVK